MDNKNLNSKTTPNQMRVLIKRMRTGNYVNESKGTIKNDSKGTTKHELSMRDMLKITRKLNEGVEGEGDKKNANKETAFDQSREEEKFRQFFNDMNVNIKFIDLEVYDDLVFWGGTINGIIQFVYKVTPNEPTPPEFNYLEGFSPDNPENEEIVGRVESYFDTFYKYWRNNMLEK